jgi:penicillin-binding protein 2
MPQRVEERIRPITPQLAWRVAVLGGVAFVLFGIVFFRLWYLQVLTGEQAVSAARENRVRKVRIEAPRGDIVDRNGVKLVTTKVAAVVEINPTLLPKAVQLEAGDYRKASAAAERARLAAVALRNAFERQLRDDGKKTTKAQRRYLHQLRRAANQARPVAVPPLPADQVKLRHLYDRLGRVMGMSPATIHGRVIRGVADQPYSNVTIRTGVPRAQFNYMREHAELFPGVVVSKKYLRQYPHTKLAAQLFGTVSEITAAELKEKKFRHLSQGARIGQSGLEETYDRYLRGTDGYQKIVVNATGNRAQQQRTSVKEPVQGDRLKLTLDYNLEKAGDQALQQAISHSAFGADAGAYVALDPRDGSILAMGSEPSFDANVFAKPITQRTYDYLTSDATGAPLLDRATESGYPTGSTFKPVTALASLQAGLISPSDVYDDTGHFKLGTQSYQNAKGAANGAINMSDAFKVSSDVYFFRLGALANDKGAIIQREARKLGFGHRTGIDIPGEAPGLVPDARWRDQGYARYVKCADKYHVPQGTTAALFKCGGIEKPWTPGDNVNLAVGQGDLEATPLQLAVAYSALENGGTVVRPHLGRAVEDSLGRTVQTLHFKARRHVHMDPGYRQTILDGLRRAANEKGGTSADVFAGFPKQYTVYGKTGTAERGINPDQSWYACFVPDKARPIVVVVTVEKGGFGAETAAPAARLILSQWFDTGDRTFHAGSSTTL